MSAGEPGGAGGDSDGPAPTAAYRLYPAHTFARAPTWDRWVKLTAADARLLRAEPGFEGQDVHFLLNHPIRHVSLLGAVVALDHLVTRHGAHVFTLELDDGSGATVEVKIEHSAGSGTGTAQQAAARDANHAVGLSKDREESNGSLDSDVEDEEDNSRKPVAGAARRSRDELWREWPTAVEGLVVRTSPLDGLAITLGGARVGSGTVLKAKGALRRWRGAPQLLLRRAFVVTSPADEAAAWRDYAAFAAAVLARPWVLGERELAEADADLARARDRERRRRARDAERALAEREREARHHAREARREARRLDECRILDGNALDRPGWQPCVEPAPVVAGLRHRKLEAPPAALDDNRSTVQAQSMPSDKNQASDRCRDNGINLTHEDAAGQPRPPPTLRELVQAVRAVPSVAMPAGGGTWYHDLIEMSTSRRPYDQ